MTTLRVLCLAKPGQKCTNVVFPVVNKKERLLSNSNDEVNLAQYGPFKWQVVLNETVLAADSEYQIICPMWSPLHLSCLQVWRLSLFQLIMKLSVFLFEIGPGCICIVWANQSWDEPGLWCFCLRGSVINGTAVHCLGSKCLGWQNTLLITSEAQTIQSFF